MFIQMMNDFLQQPVSAPSPFAMEQMRHDLPTYSNPQQRTPSPGWAAEFDPGMHSKMEAAFGASRAQSSTPTGFSPAEYANFQARQHNDAQRTTSPLTQGGSVMNGFQRPMSFGYTPMMNYPISGPTYMEPQYQQSTAEPKGKSRMVELDDQNWESQFAELEIQKDADSISVQASKDMEGELDELDRLVDTKVDESVEREFNAEWNSRQMAADGDLDTFSAEDYAAWENFDSTLGLGTHNQHYERDPSLGDYMFEQQNPFLEGPNTTKTAFEQGVEILQSHGNLSLAALAFEAAVQHDPNHVEAWTLLGSAQAQNEKETPAIRALERALQLDPNNLDALMGLAVSYTNEGYDITSYRTLERWLSVRYPEIHPPDQVSSAADIGFTDRAILHDRVTNLFIRAAQLSPQGEQMDPDVQVGLGVLFYGDEDYEKAVDCFSAALASTESGTVNREGQLHLLWNRLGATLANSGRSEDAIAAYMRALEANPNFVRARYNLGVSCINIGCNPEAASHLLAALELHRGVGQEGLDKAREIVSDSDPNRKNDPSISDDDLERMIRSNESSNLYDTLKRAFSGMGRRDLSDRVGPGMDLNAFRREGLEF